MISFIIILLLIPGIFLYIKATFYIDQQRYYNKFQVVFDAHKKIGYPPLTKQQQFDILDNGKTAPVLSLTKHNIVPTGLLNHYIKIKPAEYFEHLKSKDLLEEMRFDGIKDGFFINQTEQGFEYLFMKETA